MNEILKIIGIAFVTAIAALLLRIIKPELSLAVTVTGILIILVFTVDTLQNSIVIFSKIADLTGVGNGLLKTLLKIVGIGYITEFSAGILTDFGSPSVADKVTLCGKIVIITLSFPVIESLLNLIQGLLQWV